MITTWSKGNADECMSEDMLTGLSDIIGRHPWFGARTNFLLALLRKLGVRPPASVLDAGCGWGVNLEALERRRYRVVGLDISGRALARLNRPGRRLIEADLNRPLPHNTQQFDAVVALDVIEHLDDDRTAVARFGQLTRPGGLVIVSVPACPDLFSEFDVVQGHRRRYLPDTLRAAFADSGLGIEHVLWWGSWMVPLFRMRRNRSHVSQGVSPLEAYRRYLKPPSWPLSLVFRLTFAFEQRRALRGGTSTGTSLFAVARRPR